jgi:hypothetical protein
MRTLNNWGEEENIPLRFLRPHKKQKQASAAGSDSAPSTSRKQIPISAFMPPKLTPAEKGKFQQHLAFIPSSRDLHFKELRTTILRLRFRCSF